MIEHDIEMDFIRKLESQQYIYRDDLSTDKDRENNFRAKFNALNKVELTDKEFTRLLEQLISSDVFRTAKILRERTDFEREDGTPLNFILLDTKNWCKNTFEVVRQQHSKTEKSFHRYDVLILINGLPVVQIELKNLDVSPRQAMEQIVKYKHDPENGYTNTLLCFMQFFIVSNQSSTFYFANNDINHFNFGAEESFLPTCRFANQHNDKINHLDDFTEQFLSCSFLHETLCRYMAFVETEQKLLMMRPYQVYAVKNILAAIEENRGNGFVWHTTGSGKTLTSFKTSTLLKENQNIHKCLFVVDRKDLDEQTRKEFNQFQPNCVEENTDTKTLVNRLISTSYSDKVIVTTIQKLGIALDSTKKQKDGTSYAEKLKALQNKRVVFIFDECHRSQFGENHKAIKEFFLKAQMFGFTGTPIFKENSSTAWIKHLAETGEEKSVTTAEVFINELHRYTITHAIEDKNVLPFRVEYYGASRGECVYGVEADIAQPPSMVTKPAIVKAILQNHNKSTVERQFNAILATNSINDAIEYYQLFKEQQKDAENPLNICCVFSPPAESADIKQFQEDLTQERADYEASPVERSIKKQALIEIINDYNEQYTSNKSIADFDDYYKDVQLRIKNQKYPNKDVPHKEKIDIIIVVDMLLTGFDSKYLNTLYVDKNLRYHGLIQAFSRTNRVLNGTKPFGNIIIFKDLQSRIDEAVRLFSGESGSKTVWLVPDAKFDLDRLAIVKEQLQNFMESQGLNCTPEQIINVKGTRAKIKCLELIKEMKSLVRAISQRTDLTEQDEKKLDNLFSADEVRAYTGVYLETVRELVKQRESQAIQNTSEEANPDETGEQDGQGEQEEQDQDQEGEHSAEDGQGDTGNSDGLDGLDYELVLFASNLIDYDYIMSLLATISEDSEESERTRKDLVDAINADAKFINDREYITSFINALNFGKNKGVDDLKKDFAQYKQTQIWEEIQKISDSFGLDFTLTKPFVERTISRRILDSEELTELLMPLGLDWKERGPKEVEVIKALKASMYQFTEGREISGVSAYEEI